METRSKKRKQSLIPLNPYQRSFIKRKKDPISLNRSSSSSSSSHVKDLRTRRVFSPSPNFRPKETAQCNQKEETFDAGLSQKDEKTQIDIIQEKSDLGDDPKSHTDEKDVEFDRGVVNKDPIVKLDQENEMAKVRDAEAVKDYKVVGGGGQVKSMVKSGSLVPCSRSRVYKNPASFSYKRMLPFLMDLAKDDTNAPQINPCRKVDKSSGAQEIHAITPEKETSSDEHPVDDSPTSPFNVECSNMESPEHHVLEPTTPKSPQTSVPCKASNFVIRDLPRLFSELASQALKDPSDRVSNFNGAPYFVHDKFSPTKSSLSVVIPESSLIKEDSELDKGRLKTNGNTEGGRCEGKQIPTAPPDGAAFCKVGPGTNKDCAPKSHLNIKSVREMSRCVGEDEKDRHPNSVEIGSYEAGLIQSTPQDGDVSCKIVPGTVKDCALDSHLNNKSDHEMSRCTDENEKDSQPSSLEIENYEAELIQSTPPDGDAFCKLGPGMGKDCAPESQLSNKSDYEKNRCIGGDEKDRHPNSKVKLGILFPSSRMRLYKAPGSFSYRRLLPYLMDLSRNDPNTLGILPYKSIVKAVDDRPPSTLASHDKHKRESSCQTVINEHCLSGGDVSLDFESAEMTSPTGSSNVDCISLGSHEDPLVEFPSQNSVLKSVVQEPPGSSIVSEVQCSMITKPSHLHVESGSPIQRDTVSKSNRVKSTHDVTSTIPDTNLQTKSSPFPVNPEPSLLEDCLTGSYLLTEEVPDDGTILMQKTSTSLKSPGELSLIHEQSNTESPATPINPSSGSSTGILKKYPLGCRGLCTCLNCASFRLHAERAFEFSRNQMQDAEEVATELMKELSSIRALLGKVVDSAESCVNFQVPEVKEACTKALSTEEWAKRQLDQMYQELNIHCRIPGLPRPKVRFAGNSQMPTSPIGNSQEKILPLE